MRTSFPLSYGETQKGSTGKVLPFNLAPRLDTVSRGQQGFPFRSTNGAAAPGEVWAAARQTGPRRAAPLVLLYAVFATHPQRREYSRPPVAPAVIAPQHRRPRGEGWRVPQGSPASPWEGVSKFHYPPRCPRAQPAIAGSKVRVDRSVRSLFTSLELPSWRRAFRRYHTGFMPGILCIQLSVGGLSLLTYQAHFWRSVASINGRISKFPANFLGRSR